MKKILVLAIALGCLCGCEKNAAVEDIGKETVYVPLTDTQLINRFVDEEYGEDYRGRQYDHIDGDEYVEFYVHDNKGNIVSGRMINREYYQGLYKNS